MKKRPDRWCKPCTNQYRRDIRAGKLKSNNRVGDRCRSCGADLSHRPVNVLYCNETCRVRLFAKENPSFHRDIHLRKAYGMTQDEYDQLMDSQGGCCAICKSSDVDVWHIDHCHTTGRVRGILCPHCNRGLGMFRDQPQFLRDAALYLER
ncbi:endonuclease VII domain-containing protein [Rhodococcus qingshengii]|uniref:endonuclease VII domain-containing protein n=1 Tax=Rhodococcus qingshengii TaxID=334542 RepID=UPI0039E73792